MVVSQIEQYSHWCTVVHRQSKESSKIVLGIRNDCEINFEGNCHAPIR